MAVDDASLGGRLALLQPEALSPEQKPVFDRIGATLVPWAEAAGFRSRSDGGALIGPFNAQILSPGTASGYLDFVAAEQNHTSLTPRTREVVILTVGAIWGAPYELYAHAAVGRKAGLPEAAIQALAGGSAPDAVDAHELVAHRYARQLTQERRVDAALYAEAEAAFGSQGLADLAYLVGLYQLVCGFLAAFDVPSPA